MKIEFSFKMLYYIFFFFFTFLWLENPILTTQKFLPIIKQLLKYKLNKRNKKFQIIFNFLYKNDVRNFNTNYCTTKRKGKKEISNQLVVDFQKRGKKIVVIKDFDQDFSILSLEISGRIKSLSIKPRIFFLLLFSLAF